MRKKNTRIKISPIYKIINRKIQNKTIGGHKIRSPALSVVKLLCAESGEIIYWYERKDREKEEGNWKTRTMKQKVAEFIIMALNQGEERRVDRCLSTTGRAEE